MEKDKDVIFEEHFGTGWVILNFLHTNDFLKGVRAVLVDKAHSSEWNLRTLNEVSGDYVRSFFKYDKDDGRNMITELDISNKDIF